MSEYTESYYSSDDDVSWGPITLREVKRNLRRNIGGRKLTRRVTVGYNTPPDTKKLEDDKIEVEDIKEIVEDVTKISLNSKYFTPHETMTSMVCEELEPESLYNTVEDKTLHQPPLQSESIPSCTKEFSNNESAVEILDDSNINIKNEKVDLTIDDSKYDAEVIEISDDEDSLKEIVKEINHNIDNESFSFEKDIIDYKCRDNAEASQEKMVDENFSKIKEPYPEMLRYQGVQSKYENISGIYNLDDSGFNKKDESKVFTEDKSSHEAVLDNSQLTNSCMSEVFPKENISAASNQLCFNDTLEEIENLLANGPNYSMKIQDNTQGKAISPIPLESKTMQNLSDRKVNSLKSKIPLGPQSSKKMYGNVVSPVANYIKTSPSYFKVPFTPKKCSPLVQNNLRAQKLNYKDIKSPVGVYIKHSSTAPLYQKVQNTALQPINIECTEKKQLKENIELPPAIYKPAKDVKKKIVQNDVNLPTSIKKLFTTKVQTNKHEKKITKLLDDEDKEKQLSDGNLTVNCSINASVNDISILKCKENIM